MTNEWKHGTLSHCVCLFRSRSVCSCFIRSVPKHRRSSRTSRSCSFQLLTDQIHPEPDPRGCGGHEVRFKPYTTDLKIAGTERRELTFPSFFFFRDACHKDILNLQVEMVRQFYIQLVRDVIFLVWKCVRGWSGCVCWKWPVFMFQNEFHGLIEKYSVNESLIEENEKLREEIRRLRTNYWRRIWGFCADCVQTLRQCLS